MQYIFANLPYIAQLLFQHIWLVLISLALGLIIAIPMGVLIIRQGWLQGPVFTLLGIIYTIPSLSLFVLLIPLLGLGALPAVIALVAYAQFVLVRNWVVGLAGIPEQILEAADGMGMNGWQRFSQVEFPLALPLLLAGIRLATVTLIGIGAVAAYINAGGLGVLLFQGVTTGNQDKILAGAITISLLAIAANYLLWIIERRSELALHE